MDIEMIKESVSMPDNSRELSAKQNIDLEINLPDYCSDIKRILRCFVTPGITGVQTAGDRINAKGDIVVRLVYVGEDEKIDCYEQSIDLSVFADADELPENCAVFAKARTQYVNCRAASQRRFNVTGSVGVYFYVFSRNETEVCSGTEDKMLEIKKETVKAVGQCEVGEKMFDLSETVALDDSKKAVGRIIGYETQVIIEPTKAVSGKLLLKGEFKIYITYVGDEKESSLEILEHTMPISQIMEIPCIDDTFEYDIISDVSAVSVEAKSDASGSGRLIEIAAKIDTLVKCTKEREIEFIADCYCTKYESKEQYKNIDFIRSLGVLDLSRNVSFAPEISGQSVKTVLDARIVSSSCNVCDSENKLVFKCNAVVGILFADAEDKIQYAERNVDFDFENEIKEKCKKIICLPKLSFSALSASVNGSAPTVGFTAFLKGKIYCVIKKRVLECVAADENKPKDNGEAAITVYYCMKGEQLWNIAKRYNTSAESIMQENDLDGQITDEDRMLIITC